MSILFEDPGLLNDIDAVLNSTRCEVIKYLKGKPEGSNEFDMMKEMGIENRNYELTYHLLKLTNYGVLKQNITAMEDDSLGKIGLHKNITYTLDNERLEEIKKNLHEHLGVAIKEFFG